MLTTPLSGSDAIAFLIQAGFTHKHAIDTVGVMEFAANMDLVSEFETPAGKAERLKDAALTPQNLRLWAVDLGRQV